MENKEEYTQEEMMTEDMNMMSPGDSLIQLLEEVLDKLMLYKTKYAMHKSEAYGGAGLDDYLAECLNYKMDIMSAAAQILHSMGALSMPEGMNDGMEDESMDSQEELED